MDELEDRIGIFGERSGGFGGRNTAQNKAEVQDEIDPRHPPMAFTYNIYVTIAIAQKLA